MTTKVLIVNHGPDKVLVRTYAKDNEPGDTSWNFTSSQMIRPGRFTEMYVHGNQGLLIDEERGHYTDCPANDKIFGADKVGECDCDTRRR